MQHPDNGVDIESDSPTIDPTARADYVAHGWWRERTLIDDLGDHAGSRGDKPAIIAHRAVDGTTTLTYAELAATVDRYAAALLDLGVRPGDIVSFQLPNWWQVSALHLAAGRIGAVTNAILPILRHRELGFILGRLRSTVFVTARTHNGFDYAAMAAEVAAGIDGLDHVFAIGPGPLPDGVASFDAFFDDPAHAAAHPRAELDRLRPDPDAISQIQFTSGTTGEPKGVVHTWNTVYAGFMPSVVALGLTADDVPLGFSPLAHTTGFYTAVSMPICLGQTVILQDLWDPDVTLRLADEFGGT
ncbi:cyclohexanecarboxylate-CoA ligase [Gordonia hydrophobica]|nr:cyclohexanecarboxylate-CoA ligase [Gordonia hydrophobica]